MEFKHAPIDSVEFHDRNAKKHDLEKIKNSIQRYGFKDVIIVNNNKVVAGNGRLEALRALKVEDDSKVPENIQVVDGAWCAPMIFVEFESDAEAKAFLLDHNNITLLGGDFSQKDIEKLYDMDGLQRLYTDLESISLPDTMIGMEDLSMNFQTTLPNDVGKEVSEEQIKVAEDAETSKFSGGSDKKQVICPSCGEEYYIDA